MSNYVDSQRKRIEFMNTEQEYFADLGSSSDDCILVKKQSDFDQHAWDLKTDSETGPIDSGYRVNEDTLYEADFNAIKFNYSAGDIGTYFQALHYKFHNEGEPEEWKEVAHGDPEYLLLEKPNVSMYFEPTSSFTTDYISENSSYKVGPRSLVGIDEEIDFIKNCFELKEQPVKLDSSLIYFDNIQHKLQGILKNDTDVNLIIDLSLKKQGDDDEYLNWLQLDIGANASRDLSIFAIVSASRYAFGKNGLRIKARPADNTYEIKDREYFIDIYTFENIISLGTITDVKLDIADQTIDTCPKTAFTIQNTNKPADLKVRISGSLTLDVGVVWTRSFENVWVDQSICSIFEYNWNVPKDLDYSILVNAKITYSESTQGNRLAVLVGGKAYYKSPSGSPSINTGIKSIQLTKVEILKV